MEKVIIKSKERNEKAAKVIRREGLVPAVVYGQGKKSVPLMINKVEFEKAYREAGTSQIILLEIEGAGKKNVLVHDVVFHPVTDIVEHIDFLEISMKEKITTEVPLVFSGDSIAVIEMGGTLVTNKDTIEVECLPGDLPHEIQVDIAPLVDYSAALHVSDLVLPSGVELKNDPEEVVAFVEEPRSEEEMAELNEEIETPDLPEAEQGGEEEAGESKEE
jgi:large subunit ribosomal protein L25